jgi:hypothetical protein
VGRLRSLRRALFALFWAFCVLLSLALIVTQIGQRIFRTDAELLLTEIRSLELRKTSWNKAKAQLQRWRPNSEYGSQCNDQKCSLTITLNQFIFGYLGERNIFLRLDDYFRWRLKLSYAEGPFAKLQWAFLRAHMRLGGRPARIIATVGMRDGIVWSKGFSVYIETYADNGPWTSSDGSSVGYTLIAETHSVPRFDYYGSNWTSPQLQLHPDYMIGRPGGCEICVEGWTRFTPYAAPEDIHRLMQLELSCLTRWHPCLIQSDIMPAAWAQYLTDQPRLEALRNRLGCSPSIIELLGRDSANMATAEILAYRDWVDNEGHRYVGTRIRVLERLKGVPEWKVGETRELTDLSGIGGDSTRLRPGTQLLFFSGRSPLSKMRIDPGYGCPILLLNEANLNLVRRGIAQDYTARDKLE